MTDFIQLLREMLDRGIRVTVTVDMVAIKDARYVAGCEQCGKECAGASEIAAARALENRRRDCVECGESFRWLREQTKQAQTTSRRRK